MPSMQCVILGVDPGMHSGLTLVRLWKLDAGTDQPGLTLHTDDFIRGFAIEKCVQTTVHGMDALSRGVLDLLAQARSMRDNPVTGKPTPVFIALEAFVMTDNSDGGGKFATESIGAVKALRHVFYPKGEGVFLDNTQKPADKNLATDKILGSLDLKSPGDGQQDHAHDSARHVAVMASRIRMRGMRAIREVSNIDVFTTRG